MKGRPFLLRIRDAHRDFPLSFALISKGSLTSLRRYKIFLNLKGSKRTTKAISTVNKDVLYDVIDLVTRIIFFKRRFAMIKLEDLFYSGQVKVLGKFPSRLDSLDIRQFLASLSIEFLQTQKIKQLTTQL